MKESEARIELATNQNEIFKKIFNNIGDNSFDLSIDLSEMKSSYLRDYWIHTIGFLLVQNYENFGFNFSEDDINKIVNGNFKLKFLTAEETVKLKGLTNRSTKTKGTKEITPLYTIQDGSYSIVTNKAATSPKKRNQLILSTDIPKYFTDDDNFNMTSMQLMQIIRNKFAHSVPYVNGSNIILIHNNDLIEVPKMWLRGYSELFSQTQQQIDVNKLINAMKNRLSNGANKLMSFQDIDKMLSLIKNEFDQDIQKDYFRINNFIKLRLNLSTNFFSLPIDEKISIIANLFANNPNYLKSSAETINPKIIYNLQQLVATELTNRGENLDLSMTNVDYEKIHQLENDLKRLKSELDKFDISQPSKMARTDKIQYNYLANKFNELLNERTSLIAQIKTKSTLESSLMHIYDIDALKVLPAEVAVNTVCLMGFNALVTSAFYDDLISKSNSQNLTEHQQKYFGALKINGITYKHNGKTYDFPYDCYTKFYILKELRNSICHGLITYQIPSKKANETISFKDIEITFFVEYENAEISGKLIDFFNLFSNDKIFFKRRPEKIITGPQRNLTEKGEPILNDQGTPPQKQ